MLRPLVRMLAALSALAVIAASCSGFDRDSVGREDPGPSTTEPPETGFAASAASSATAAFPDGDTDESSGDAAPVQPCADVVGAAMEPLGDGTYRIDATVRSGDTGWDKYADAWEVRTREGTVLGMRLLAHPHETEQPFTRSLSPVEIGPGIDEVVLAARDSVNGFCGETLTVAVPG